LQATENLNMCQTFAYFYSQRENQITIIIYWDEISHDLFFQKLLLVID